MSLRVAALLVLAVALGVWVAAVRPATQQLALAQQEFGRARGERERLRSQTTVLERKVAAHARLVGASSARPGDPVKALRLFVVDSVSRAPLTDVRLEASPGRGPAVARVRLTASGSFREILLLLERLRGPESGIALERVQLTAGGAGTVQADVEGFTLGAASS